MESISAPSEPAAHPDRGYIPAPLRRKRLEQEEDRMGVGTGPPSPLFSPPTPPSCFFPPRSDRDRTLDQESLLRSLCERDPEDDDSMGGMGEADPVLDDLFTRRVEQSLRQTSSNPSYDRFLPRYWTPEEETRVHRIKLGSQRRPWYRKMFGLSRKIQGSSED